MSERGKRPSGARRTPRGSGQAHRPLLPPGRGGGPVVVVAVTRHQGGRESRPQGEGSSEPAARSDARRSPVNTGALLPDEGSGYFTDDGSCTSGPAARAAHGKPDRGDSQVRFGVAAARKPPAERPAPAPRRRPCARPASPNTSASAQPLAEGVQAPFRSLAKLGALASAGDPLCLRVRAGVVG